MNPQLIEGRAAELPRVHQQRLRPVPERVREQREAELREATGARGEGRRAGEGWRAAGAAGCSEALPVPEGDVVALRDDEHGTDAGGDESVGEAGEREPAR